MDASQRGIGLPEVLLVLALAAVLLVLANPSLATLHGRQVVAAQAQGLHTALRRARSEAMTRGETVTTCALAAPAPAAPACSASGRDWSAGWLVFVDRGPRGRVDSHDRVLWVHTSPAPGGAVLSTTRYLSYRHNGALLTLAAHFRVLPPGQPPMDAPVPGSALVCVNKPGRPRLASLPHCD